jgi:hypothetical protein
VPHLRRSKPGPICNPGLTAGATKVPHLRRFRRKWLGDEEQSESDNDEEGGAKRRHQGSPARERGVDEGPQS